jgi:hypothetical protein
MEQAGGTHEAEGKYKRHKTQKGNLFCLFVLFIAFPLPVQFPIPL